MIAIGTIGIIDVAIGMFCLYKVLSEPEETEQAN